MVQPTHQPDAVLTLRVTPALRARLGELLERVPDTGAARLSRHGLAVWCLERGLLEAEADPDVVLRAPARAPSKPSVSSLAETSPTTPSSSPTPSAPASRGKRSKSTETSPTTPSSSPSVADADALRTRWNELGATKRGCIAATGLNESTVYRWLTGRKVPTAATLATLANYLDSLTVSSTG